MISPFKPTKCVGVGLYYLRGSSYRNYYKGLKKKFKIMFNDWDSKGGSKMLLVVFNLFDMFRL